MTFLWDSDSVTLDIYILKLFKLATLTVMEADSILSTVPSRISTMVHGLPRRPAYWSGLEIF